MARLPTAVACLALLSTIRADDQTDKMTQRLSEEADAFQKLAPEVLGRETLQQRAQKPPSRFHPRVGASALVPPPIQWKKHEVVSEYGFTSFSGAPGALHELRQVISVDGRGVADAKKAQDTLAKLITASDDEQKKEALKQFEKYGLSGAATDFGQLILLFTRRELERYEFTEIRQDTIGGIDAMVFSYKQLDGPEALTLIEANKKDHLLRLRVQGEIWVRADNDLPLRITLEANGGEGASAVQEEATVEYAMSRFGALLPVLTLHRELRAGKVLAENHFTYGDFHKFGASSGVKFDEQK